MPVMKLNRKCFSNIIIFTFVILLNPVSLPANNINRDLRELSVSTMRKAAIFFRNEVASHGGYVYYYSIDLQQCWGEGQATAEQIWVQPPGTPTVGMAYLKAYEATGEKFYLDAATDAAEALIYGQLQSGGWTNCIDFNPNGTRTALYRNGKGQGKNYSSLDDGQTQSAIRFLALTDKTHKFNHKKIHESTILALDALLAAQFPNGGFPQVWKAPVERQPITKASYPNYDWRTEGRIKDYWNMYTLNDNVPGYITQTLIDADRIYRDEKYKMALRRLGDFLLLAQMPDPQPAWAQQYNYQMNPIWARKFEPAAIAGDESQEVIETLMDIYAATGKHKYLEPIPQALDYLKRSLLPDGRLARFYELKTNKPLYMFRRGDVYTLTYDDSDLPSHYGWKISSRLEKIESRYNQLNQVITVIKPKHDIADLERHVRKIIADLDEKGRWISTYQGKRLTGQPKFKLNTPYISSEVFSRNIETLSEYIIATHKN
jgi:PelA/Pel-15E family pectate lyase